MSSPIERAPKRVVVITGASSGIGRATALELAQSGAHLALISRDPAKLAEVAAAVTRQRAGGVKTFAVDVNDAAALETAARDIFAAWGRLDVWINNAGVGAIGSFSEVPIADHRRVIETNILGYLNGAHSALRIFREQGQGTLINNASIGAYIVVPYAASYTASKYAIRGLSLALRLDTELDGFKRIHVCLVHPSVVDTPAFDHAANYSGTPIRVHMPLVGPGQVARAIARLIENPRREIYVGRLGRFGTWGTQHFPWLADRIMLAAARIYLARATARTGPTAGALFRSPREPSRSSGDRA